MSERLTAPRYGRWRLRLGLFLSATLRRKIIGKTIAPRIPPSQTMTVAAIQVQAPVMLNPSKIRSVRISPMRVVTRAIPPRNAGTLCDRHLRDERAEDDRDKREEGHGDDVRLPLDAEVVEHEVGDQQTDEVGAERQRGADQHPDHWALRVERFGLMGEQYASRRWSACDGRRWSVTPSCHDRCMCVVCERFEERHKAGTLPRHGAVAQLVERHHGMVEVRGSIRVSSTVSFESDSQGFMLGGLVAGEGTFSVQYRRQHFAADGSERLRFRFSMSMAQRDRPLLEQLRSLLGAGSIRVRDSADRTTNQFRYLLWFAVDCRSPAGDHSVC